MLNEPTRDKLKALKLDAMAQAWDEQQRNPEVQKLNFDERFGMLVDEDWEWGLRDHPESATQVGDRRYDDKLDDMSLEAIERRKVHAREMLARAKKIDASKLGEVDRTNLALFVRNYEIAVEGQRFPDELLVLNQLYGVHRELADIAEIMPRKTVADHENFLKRIAAYPALVDQHIALLRRGVEKKITPPRIVMRDVVKLIENQVSDDVEKSFTYETAFTHFPETIPEADRARLQAAAKRALAEQAMPALRKFRDFVARDYLPKTRETTGLSSLPDGQAWYAYNARATTTTDMSPEKIHALGLSEVARIRGEMTKIMKQTGFTGTLPEFFKFLRSDPRFFYTDKEALLTGYREICKRIDPELPRLFGTLPRLTYGVKPVPAHSEKTQTTAYYVWGAPDIGRAGTFYANTYDLATRPKWEMEALTLHEAVPGHHLQIALSQEQGELPKFRRYGGYTAFVEGWGLYAESLGPEIGLFVDPYSHFGQLTYEMWRAVRLVVDTGMHVKGWSRDQAITYFKDNAGKTEHDIIVEIDRYIVWPGQALAYKIGQLKLRELRTLAEKSLGPKFDARTFHDLILGAGALPLDVLEKRVRATLSPSKPPK